jgi:hypothetical protein
MTADKEQIKRLAMEAHNVRLSAIQTFEDARKFARRCLSCYRMDKSVLEQKRLQFEMVGSLKIQRYDNQAGKVSAQYYPTVPWWYEEKDTLEYAIREMELRVLPIGRLLSDLAATDAEMVTVYTVKYDPPKSWPMAKSVALDEHHITETRFRTVEHRLAKMAITYLGLEKYLTRGSTLPKTLPETLPDNLPKSSEIDDTL